VLRTIASANHLSYELLETLLAVAETTVEKLHMTCTKGVCIRSRDTTALGSSFSQFEDTWQLTVLSHQMFLMEFLDWDTVDACHD
jgi:hypothetical protein